ncbi:MAG: cupin domain-containing protein [Elusimicrobia bacterium]|nr:cupin domain-containing protein [Elusimicrobiota bacterium]
MKNKMPLKIVPKPWGKELWFAYTKKYLGKLLFIKKGHRLSLQYHKKKDESLYVLKGPIFLQIGKSEKKVKTGSNFHVPANTLHRMHAKYVNSILIEVSTPENEDVVRLEDDYARVK